MIYFVLAESLGVVKIGYTAGNMKHRLESLQTGCPAKLTVLGFLPGGISEEKALHKRFVASHKEGEWFRLGPDLIAFLGKEVRLWPENFVKLVEIEPAIGELWEAANAFRMNTPDPFCANACWYGYCGYPGFKPKVCRLVGWEARKEVLRTPEAYDLAYDFIADALPGCRNCAC